MTLPAEIVQARKSGIGGSDSPVVLGVSPFKSITDLWYEKCGSVDESPPSLAMQRGTHLEPIAADTYAEKTGRKVRRVNRILRHKDHNWMLGNVDRQIVGETSPGVLEIKCPGLSVFAKCKREGLPDYYQIQLQHYLAVTGYSWGAFAVFNAERWELVHFDVKRDDELIGIIIERDAAFWNSVLTGEPPAMDTPVIELPPTEPTELLTLDTPEWLEVVQELREAQEIRREAEALEEAAKARIKEIMTARNATVVEGAGARVYYRFQKGRTILDTKRLRRDYRDIPWANYEKVGQPFQTLKPYWLKGDMVNE